MDIETDNDSQKAYFENDTTLLAIASAIGKKGKKGRPKKQKSPNKAQYTSTHSHTSSQGNNIELVNTRSKTGKKSQNNNIVSHEVHILEHQRNWKH